MSSRYEVEVTISSAKDLKNVNWRHGPLRPYAVVWVDPNKKCSTKVDEEGDNNPFWDATLVVPLPPGASLTDSTLHIDVVHAGAEDDTKPLIGSARLSLDDVVEDVGIGEKTKRSLQLRRPSGRPQGKLDVKVAVRDTRYHAPDPYYAPPYGVPPPGSRDYVPPPPPPAYGAPYAAPPSGYPYGSAPPSGYPYGASAPPPPVYAQGSYGQPAYVREEKKSKFGGMGTGVAVGAAAGLLGGLALAEGADYVEDKIAEEAAERVEDDLGYDEGGDDW